MIVLLQDPPRRKVVDKGRGFESVQPEVTERDLESFADR